jgi:hypothetical protein
MCSLKPLPIRPDPPTLFISHPPDIVMTRFAAHLPGAIGLLLLLSGLAPKVMKLPIPEWFACMNVTAGLIAIIFALGRRS